LKKFNVVRALWFASAESAWIELKATAASLHLRATITAWKSRTDCFDFPGFGTMSRVRKGDLTKVYFFAQLRLTLPLRVSDAGALNPERLEPNVIICQCAVISDRDIELAVSEIMSAGPGLLPTPGVVFRHLNKKMNCCTCAPLTVAAIYSAMDRLEQSTRVCPFALAEARAKLIRIEERRERRQRRLDDARANRRAGSKRAVA
jgi:hypothetical protein